MDFDSEATHSTQQQKEASTPDTDLLNDPHLTPEERQALINSQQPGYGKYDASPLPRTVDQDTASYPTSNRQMLSMTRTSPEPTQPRQATNPLGASPGAKLTDQERELMIREEHQRQSAMQDQVGFERQQAKTMANYDQNQADQAADNQAASHAALMKAQNMDAEIQKGRHIDPDRHWNSLSGAGKALAAVSVFFGALGQGLSHGALPNTGLDELHRHIDEDIASQKDAWEHKKESAASARGLYGLYRQQGLDDAAAAAAAKASYLARGQTDAKIHADALAERGMGVLSAKKLNEYNQAVQKAQQKAAARIAVSAATRVEKERKAALDEREMRVKELGAATGAEKTAAEVEKLKGDAGKTDPSVQAALNAEAGAGSTALPYLPGVRDPRIMLPSTETAATDRSNGVWNTNVDMVAHKLGGIRGAEDQAAKMKNLHIQPWDSPQTVEWKKKEFETVYGNMKAANMLPPDDDKLEGEQ